MRQGNGTDVLGNDPRSANVGIIYVSPTDDRKSVLAAIITQERFNREQVAIVLPPGGNKAFRLPGDFDDLKSMRRKLQTEIVFIVPAGSGPADFARQRRFPVYSTLENYASALRAGQSGGAANSPAKKVGIFGFGRQKPADTPSAPNTPNAPVKRSTQPLPPAYAPQGQGNMGANAALAGAAGLGALAGADLAVQAQNNAANVRSGQPAQPAPSPQPVQPVQNMSPASSAASGGPIVFEEAGDDMDENDANSLPPLVPTPMPPPAPSPTVTTMPNLTPSGKVPVVGTGSKAGPDPIELSPRRGKPTVKLPAEPVAAPIIVPPLVTPQRRNTGKTPAVAAGAAFVGAGVGAATVANRGGGAFVPPTSPMRPNTGRGNNNPQRRPPRRGRTLLLVLALLLLTALLACGGFAYAYPSAVQNTLGAVPHLFTGGPINVTITPKNQVVSHSYVITAVTGTPSTDPKDRQIKAIPLSYTTPATKSQPVQTTGVKNIAATPAHGTLTLVNTTKNPYTFGTQTPIVSSGGITVHLDAPVTIPASDLVNGIIGKATGTATTATSGANTNIPVGGIDTTNSNNPVQIINKAVFTGGQDAKHYNFATQNDVNTAATSLQTSLKQQAQSALQTKATTDQPLADNITCTPKATPDQPVGDTGTAVNTLTVTVTATCNAEAYDAKGLRTLMGTLLQSQADADLGKGYTLKGNVLTKVSVESIDAKGNAFLNANAQGRYAYNLDNQVNAFRTLMKGLSVDKARSALLGQAGVSDVQFPNGTTTLPTDVNQINIIIAYPQGFTTSGGLTGTPTPAGTGTNGNG